MESDIEITREFFKRINSGWKGITTSEDQNFRDMICKNLNNNRQDLNIKALIEALDGKQDK